MIAQAGGHLEHIRAPAEEAIGVVLLKRGQPRVWAGLGIDRTDVPRGEQRLERGEQLRRAGDASFLPFLEAAIDGVGEPVRE